MNPRRGSRLLVTAALAAALVLPAQAFAAGTGGGAGSGDGAGDTTGSLYSDLVVALRGADGTPVIKEYYVPATAEEEAANHFCVQPVSYAPVPGVAATENPDPQDGRPVYVIPLQGELIGSTTTALEPCDPQPQYSMFVAEAELERLNLVRTSESVLESKLADVKTKLDLAHAISLDAAGRIALDGSSLDAAPEYAAMYSSLMQTGTIPGLDEDPARIEQGDLTYGPYELGAVAIGTAAGKYVPITVDTVQYYNRAVGFTALPAPTWGFDFVAPKDPVLDVNDGQMPRDALPGSELFVDYGDFSATGVGPGSSAFTYNRSQTFPGSVTWLDVPNLTWRVDRILDVVDFENLTDEPIGNRTLKGVTAFAQMADDVRAVIVYLHENEVIPGFYMDSVGLDTTTAQQRALTDAAVDLADLPASIFPTMRFPFRASLYNPWAGQQLVAAEMRLTIDAGEDLTASDVTMQYGAGGDVALEVADGDLTATFPASALVVGPGHRQEVALEAVVDAAAPVGDYAVTLELWADPDGAGPAPLAPVKDSGGEVVDDSVIMTVNDNVPTVLWRGDLPAVATQGSTVQLPIRVYSPVDGAAELRLTVTGPGDTPPAYMPGPTRVEPQTVGFTEAATHGGQPSDVGEPEVPRQETLALDSLKVFGATPDGTDMVGMPLVMDDTHVVGSWPLPLAAGYNDVLWFLTVADFAPLGDYVFDVVLGDVEPTVPAPEITVQGELGSSAVFALSSFEGAALECRLTTNAVPGDWESCTGSKSYENLAAGTYVFSARATDPASGLTSAVSTKSWTVSAPTTPPSTDPPTTPPSTDPPTAPPSTDPPTDPAGPDEAGSDEAGSPATFVVKGPRNNAWVLHDRVTFRLRSNGDDARYRVTLDGRRLDDCVVNRCVVDGLRSGTHRVRIAAMFGGKVDQSPVVRTFTVPRGLEQLRLTEQWNLRERDGVAFGDFVQTRKLGETVRTRVRTMKRLALVVSKGEGYGKVRVFLGDRLVRRIDLDSATAQRGVVVPVAAFATARRGVVRVVVASSGSPVRIHGLGIATR